VFEALTRLLYAEPEPPGSFMTVMASSSAIAAEIVGSLAASLSLMELSAVADFPSEVLAAGSALQAVTDSGNENERMLTDAADATDVIKSLVRFQPRCPLSFSRSCRNRNLAAVPSMLQPLFIIQIFACSCT
jgi:hypothetical protein